MFDLNYIRDELFRLQDESYRDFQMKLIPSLKGEAFIGIRTPALRKFAKQIQCDEIVSLFLSALPHDYFDENQLHAFLISEINDYDRCIDEVNNFLPYVDNWATCDQLSPKIFKRHRKELLEQINVWLRSEHTYTVRFGICTLMRHYLDDDFDPAYPELVAQIHRDDYYVNMMIAWYFATALSKQYHHILPFIENNCLSAWTHNKTIQKACESYRITPEEKEHLKRLRIMH